MTSQAPRHRLDILYFVQLPPPIHGVSVLNQRVIGSSTINHGWNSLVLEIRFSDQIAQLNKVSLGKLVSMFGLARRLAWLCIAHRPRCVYFTLSPLGHGFLRDLLYLSIMKVFRVTPILHLHRKGLAKIQSRVQRALYRFAFKGAYVLHGSPGLMRSEITPILDIGVRGIIVANGTDDPYGEPHPTSTGSEPARLLFCSSLFRSKGIFLLLQAVQNLHTPFVLEIVGTFPDKATQEALLAFRLPEGHLGQINFLGHLSDPEKQEAYRRATIFVHPTFDDTFPLVILEAMAAALPVVATREGAIPEIVTEHETGLLLDCGDEAGLTSNLEFLLSNPGQARSMGLKAREAYLRNYTTAHFEARMRSALESILGSPEPPTQVIPSQDRSR